MATAIASGATQPPRSIPASCALPTAITAASAGLTRLKSARPIPRCHWRFCTTWTSEALTPTRGARPGVSATAAMTTAAVKESVIRCLPLSKYDTVRNSATSASASSVGSTRQLAIPRVATSPQTRPIRPSRIVPHRSNGA